MISVSNLRRALPLVDELARIELAMDRAQSSPRFDENSSVTFAGRSSTTLSDFRQLSGLTPSELGERLGGLVHDALLEKREELVVKLELLGVLEDDRFAAIPGSDES